MAPLSTLLLLIFFAAAPLHAFQLHHRILHPSLPQPSFHNRASIFSDVTGHSHIDPAPTFQSDFAAFAETAHVTDALYQLALDPGSDLPWLISSVKAVSNPSFLPRGRPLTCLPAVSPRRYCQ